MSSMRMTKVSVHRSRSRHCSVGQEARDHGDADVRLRGAYDALAPVWTETTDDNLWNEVLDRRPIRSLLPAELAGLAILDAGTATGTMASWLLDRGAQVTGIDLSPPMVDTARQRCEGRGRFFVADLARPLALRDARLTVWSPPWSSTTWRIGLRPWPASFVCFVRAAGWSSR